MGTSNCPDDAKDNVGAAGSNNSDDDKGKGTEYDEAQTMTTSTKTSTSYLAAIDDREFNGNFELNEITIENENNLMEVSRIPVLSPLSFLI